MVIQWLCVIMDDFDERASFFVFVYDFNYLHHLVPSQQMHPLLVLLHLDLD